MQRVGFAGLGAMGSPMAKNLHKAGVLAAIWNRTASKAQSLAAELGCPAPANLADFAALLDGYERPKGWNAARKLFRAVDGVNNHSRPLSIGG